MSSGAEVVVEALERAGVEVVFGLPGVHNLALWAALRESSIRLVGVRHEQAAAYAADGYARATGQLGVAIVTTGPGAANTLGAVGEAWASRSPILVIATDIPSTLRRSGEYRGILHETDGQAAMFVPVTKSVHLAHAAGDVARATVAALDSADGEPARPVYLEIATDLLTAEAPGLEPLGNDALDVEGRSPGGFWDAVAALNGARRPLIWAGGGARDVGPHVGHLAERLAAPVLTTYGAAGVLPPGHPHLVGLPPHVEAAGRLWDEADVVLAIGSDLDGVQTQNFAQPQPETLIVIGLEEPTNYRADVFVRAHAGTIAPLAASVEQRSGGAPDLAAVRAAACATLDPTALRFLDSLRFALPADANLVVDMCIPGYWCAGFFTPSAPRKLQVPLGWGTLGYAFPAALGTALADTGPTVSISGDGGFLFASGELATMAQEQIPLTAVIVDDGGYGMLRYDQVRAGSETFGVDLHTPDFEALAASFGVWAETVFGLDDDFGEALARHIESGQPSVLVAKTPDPLVPPPNTSPNWYRKR
ncbi:thiamine pyrophosphate-binding protein [Solirubrobacter phytolaccae]|uniref:Thiamine pyrophosphate-binding protein n=1 Tax=Solirubrobacter phytolaccae TaxID=1404360 RepID=A0A9X3NAK7_9ACTN|nr:thiamine pyrophosphate-binding protein [Solirubrobacter phytolaccae]MDA0181524.1 thiamine pyrophosphate-binding protein [Solirubrobacter phytolaccae]